MTVKLYTVNNRSGGGSYRQFVLAYRDGEGRRRTRKFSGAEAARTEAELTATKLASGEADVLTLSSVERGQYLRSRPLLEAFGGNAPSVVRRQQWNITGGPESSGRVDSG